MLTSLRTLWSRLAASLGIRAAHDRETDDEIRLHLEMLADRFTAQGMTGGEARWAAMQQFGRSTARQENVREKRTFPQFDMVWRDTVFAFRQLRRKPSFTTGTLFALSCSVNDLPLSSSIPRLKK